jgi:hypothetical protein
VTRCYPNPNTIALEYQLSRYSELASVSTFCQEQDTAMDHHEGQQDVANVLRTMAKIPAPAGDSMQHAADFKPSS